MLSRVRLTTPSRGRPAGGPPLTSNVSPQQRPLSVSRWCALQSVAARANANARAGQPWSQQALPAACEFTGALNWCLRSPRSKRVGQARASLPYPTPMLLTSPGHGCRARPVVQMQPRRCHSSSVRAMGAFGQASPASVRSAVSLLVGQVRRSQLRLAGTQVVAGLQPRHRPSPLTRSSRAAEQASGWQTPRVGCSLNTQRANPSVKGTSCGKPQAAPYVER